MIGVEYRTHTVVAGEDADDGCESTVVEMIRYVWMCPRCLTVLGKWDDFCSFCSWSRSDHGWLCETCRHLNHQTSKACELCGLPQPDRNGA